MKKRKVKKVLVIAFGVVLMSSCTITKRRYSKGFYIEKNKSYTTNKEPHEEKGGEEKKNMKDHEYYVKEESGTIESVEKEKVITESKESQINKTPVCVIKEAKTRIVNNSEKSQINEDQTKKDDGITEKEMWSYISLVFTLLSPLLPFFISPLAIVFAFKGFSGNKDRLARWCFWVSLFILLLGVVLFIVFGELSFFSLIYYWYPLF